MTKHLSDDRPPAYDSQIFFPPEIKHHKKDQNASSVSVIYFKTACAAKAFYSCPAIISQRLESRIISKEPQENTEEEESKVI